MRMGERFIRTADFAGVLGLGFSTLALADERLGLDLLPGDHAMPVFLACFFGAVVALTLARCVQIGSVVLQAPRVESMRSPAVGQAGSSADAPTAA